ncbi:MAG: hypothetical protein V4534_05425 [Myxococcota bacterium]
MRILLNIIFVLVFLVSFGSPVFAFNLDALREHIVDEATASQDALEATPAEDVQPGNSIGSVTYIVAGGGLAIAVVLQQLYSRGLKAAALDATVR